MLFELRDTERLLRAIEPLFPVEYELTVMHGALHSDVCAQIDRCFLSRAGTQRTSSVVSGRQRTLKIQMTASLGYITTQQPFFSPAEAATSSSS
mmetsp:Transcript_22785/g.25328  ORF Transcript_22785/g.25328 Transcript_22785/m.25328 type:complete len:94 (-) Transcript_22785:11-292(-)